MLNKSDVFNKMPAKMGAQPNMQFELRVFTMDDLMNETPTMNLSIAVLGTPSEILAYIDSKKLIWKDSPTMIFGGYWYDRVRSEAYLPV